MKKYMSIGLVIFALASVASAQTTNDKYEVTAFELPPPQLKAWEIMSVAADGKGAILGIRRSDPPIAVFTREGKFVKTWGDGFFADKHSIDVDREGFVWITDRKAQQVLKYTMDGRQILAIGTKGVTGDNSSKNAFNQPNDVVVASNGDVWISDGYGNSRVMHFTKDGKFVKMIGGAKGPGPNQFDLPHGIGIDSKGRVLVLDRQEESGAFPQTKKPRVHVFDQDGKLIEQWTNLGLLNPGGLAISADDTVYIGESDGEKITVVKDGKVIDVIAGIRARAHNIALDPGTGDIYVADTTQPGGGIKRVVKKK